MRLEPGGGPGGGGMGRLVVRCGAIQSAFGFTMVYALVVALVACGTGHMPERALRWTAGITYLAVIVLGIVVLALGPGVFTTYAPIRNYAGSRRIEAFVPA